MKLVFCKLVQHTDELVGGRRLLLGMFDNITVSSYPCPCPPLTLVLEVEGEPVEAGRPLTVEVIFIDDDGHEYMKAEIQGTCPHAVDGLPGRQFFEVPFQGGLTQIPKAGRYRFDIVANGNHIGGERLIFSAPS